MMICGSNLPVLACVRAGSRGVFAPPYQSGNTQMFYRSVSEKQSTFLHAS